MIFVVDAKLLQLHYLQTPIEFTENGLFLHRILLYDHISLRSEESGRTGSRWQMTIDEHAACPALRQMGCSSGGPQLRLRTVSSSLLKPSHQGWWQLLRQRNSCVQLMKWALGVYCSIVPLCDTWHLDQINTKVHLEILMRFCRPILYYRSILCYFLSKIHGNVFFWWTIRSPVDSIFFIAGRVFNEDSFLRQIISKQNSSLWAMAQKNTHSNVKIYNRAMWLASFLIKAEP